MKATILIAWFFVAVSSQGVAGMVGPFNDKSECDKMRSWVTTRPGKPVVSACWWANAS
jgi:hypothetical protein